MTPSDDEGLARVRAVVTARLGLLLEDARLEDLEEAVRARVERTGAGSVGGYAELLDGPRGHDELRAIAERITVGETYFFRNPAQLQAYAEVMLPLRAAARQGELAVLSAGCASGEEAYTLAMIARDVLPERRVSVTGVDVNPAAIARARRGAYSEWSLRQVDPALRAREFTRRIGRDLQLRAETRALVAFEERNLARDDPAFWRPGRFDIVFFRNVGMYLEPGAYRDAVARIAGALAPGGYLVLGDAETLRGVSTAFELRHTHGAFYYQLRDAPSLAARPAALAVAAGGEPAPAAQVADDRWVAAIADASARIERLALRSAIAPPPDRWDVAPVLALLRQERLDAAQAALEALPAAASFDPEVLLLRAVVLVNRGRAAAAARACEELLAIDGLHAGAHYVLALCAEHERRHDDAVEHDLTAAHLDPTFAMPRLHLGLLASRAGRREDARREFERALELLPREQDERLLLFGGGFEREALAALCQRELRRLGGAA